MSRNEALRSTFSRTSVLRSLIVAVVVGTALNLINQGVEVFNGHAPVPFAVASYGSYAAFRASA